MMQPYFFPYLGYFELIAISDMWVVFDNTQYNKRTWMNRNRMLHPKGGWQYIGVPVQKSPHGTLIKDIRVVDARRAMTRILRQLDHYRRCAPYYDQTISLIRAAFANAPRDCLVDINVSTLKETCAFLGVNFNWTFCSEMESTLDGIEHAGRWALRVAQQLGAREYVNPPGGRTIFRPEEWRRARINLTFTSLRPFPYTCAPFEHVEHLSILDVLMWNGATAVREELLRRRSLPRHDLRTAGDP
jgi:hypothetical protein